MNPLLRIGFLALLFICLLFPHTSRAQVSFDKKKALYNHTDIASGLNVKLSTGGSLSSKIYFSNSSVSRPVQTAFIGGVDTVKVVSGQSSIRIDVAPGIERQDFWLIASQGRVLTDSMHIVVLPNQVFSNLVQFDRDLSPQSLSTPEERKDGLTREFGRVFAFISKEYPFESSFTIEVDWRKSTCPNLDTIIHFPFVSDSYKEGSGFLAYSVVADSLIADNGVLRFVLKGEDSKVWDTLEVVIEAHIPANKICTKVKSFNQYISIGGSADFINNRNRLNSYFDVYVETPAFRLFKPKVNASSNKRWVTGGQLFSGSTVSTRDTSISRTFTLSANQPENLGLDSAQFVERTVFKERVLASRFVSVSGFLRWNIFGESRNGHQLSLLVHGEYLERNIQTEVSEINDSVEERFFVNALDQQSVTTNRGQNFSTTRGYSEGMLAGGLRYQYEDDKVMFYMEHLFGRTYYDLADRTQLGFSNPSRFGFNTHFALIAKEYGVKLGGDIRSKIIFNSQYESLGLSRANTKPLFTLFLTKSFDIVDLANFISK